jgi:hypothetical protein
MGNHFIVVCDQLPVFSIVTSNRRQITDNWLLHLEVAHG